MAKRALAVLIALAILASVGFYLALDGIVRRAAARDATRALALPTTVGAADASPFRGRIEFADIRIASPRGYASPLMLDVPAASMNASYAQLRGDPVRIPSMALDRPVLVVESLDGKLNLKRMIEQMPSRAEPLMLVIDELAIRDATVIFKAGTLGVATDVSVPLSTFTLSKIGHVDADGDGQPDGARLGAVMRELLAALAARAGESDRAPADLRLMLKGDWAGAAKTKLIKALPEDVGQMLGGILNAGGKEQPKVDAPEKR